MIITCIFSLCLILISLDAFQTHYVDIEDKFPAIFQLPFHCFRIDVSFLRPTLSLFLVSMVSRSPVFAIVLPQIAHIFADVQHPKMGTLFPPEILHRGEGLLNAFHEFCSSLSILGWYLLFLQKIVVHFWPCSDCDSFSSNPAPLLPCSHVFPMLSLGASNSHLSAGLFTWFSFPQADSHWDNFGL